MYQKFLNKDYKEITAASSEEKNSTLGQQQQQQLPVQQRKKHQHYTARRDERKEQEQNEASENLQRTEDTCELISAHNKVDQWLLQNFKANLNNFHLTSARAPAINYNSSSIGGFKPSITTLHIPTPKLPGLEVATNGATIIIPKLAHPTTSIHLDISKSSSDSYNDRNLNVSMITTNCEQQHHSTQATDTNIQQLHTSSHPATQICNFQTQHQKSLDTHQRFISSVEMDADFWQQARGAPFNLHNSLAPNSIPHHAQASHLQHHQQQPPPSSHHLTEQTTPTQDHVNRNVTSIPQGDTSALTHQQHHPQLQQQQHQQQHHHHIHHQHQQQNLQHHHLLDEQHQLQHHHTQHSHITQLGNEQSHHILFNAAAAAAAAAHLSGVVKSNELSDITAAEDDGKVVSNSNSSSSNNNNNNDHIEQSATIAKQEPLTATNNSNGLGVYICPNATTNSKCNHTPSQQVVCDQQHQQSSSHLQNQEHHKHLQQHSLKFEQQPPSPGSLPLKALQHQLQQQIHQQQKHSKEPGKPLNGNETQKPENQLQQHPQHPFHNMHPQHHQLPANSIDNKSVHCDQQQIATTTALAPTSPLRISSLIHHQTPTSSPQPSLTSPSAGSSTPDLKFNSDNNKLPNELQLQLSRSNSAAAISERTLEECWSTLQRLFMHKSAMQQMQQQIPRAGLGPGGGTGGIGAESKPHQCQQCMKSFSSNHQLVQHIRVHTGEKPYKCSYCDRRFKQLSHVQQHTRLHTGERPYKCHLPDCGRAFIQLSNLQQHLRNHDAQVERAKNRPFHCNICGKGFATESSLRTHTSKELQLHLGVLQQHAALIGGPNATSCPVCHKLFLGTDALMEHMKHVHKEKTAQPNNNPFSESVCGSTANNLSNTGSSSCLQSSGASSSNDPYSAKRRNANHPCPVCGKHYVNEGSLRKHLACHAETSQLTNSLRMWPCSVCQAVFTYENGLLTHMEHMRMDPKHQFAAQYVLSRAAAERRDRDNILAATLAASSGSSGAGLIPLLGEGSGAGGGGSNSLCPSPSANSECSSNGRLSSSAASDPGSGINLLNSTNNNNNNNNNNHVNNNCNSSNSNLSLSNKLNDILRTGSSTNHPLCAPPHPHPHSHSHNPHQNHAHTLASHSYGGMPGVDADLQNRMSLMAAASAAAAAVAASANNTSVAGLSSPQRFGVEPSHPTAGNAVVQAAVVNLAAAMRLNHTSGSTSSTAGGTNNDSSLESSMQQTPNAAPTQSSGQQNHISGRTMSPGTHHQGLQDEASTAVMNAMRDSMMRTTMMETSAQDTTHHQQQIQLQSSGHNSYGNANNANMTAHQSTNHHHAQQQQTTQHLQHLQQNPTTATGSGALQHLHSHHSQAANNPLQTTASPPPSSSHLPETTLHMHQQAEAILRSHTEAAFRLAASVVQQQSNEVTTNNNSNNNNNNNNNNTNEKHEQTQLPPQHQHQQQTKNPLTEESSQHKIHLHQNTQDISEVIRLQEHRLEQALRLHNDARTFNFLNPSATQQQQHQQLNNPTNHTNSNTSNATQPPQQHHHTT